MSIFSLFNRRSSAPVARERLQILLAHERGTNCNSDLIALLQKEVLAAIAKHIDVDPDKVQIKMERREDVSLLEIDVEIPMPKPKGGKSADKQGDARAADRYAVRRAGKAA
ncbi:MAG: minE [Hyphomicrobiales bacterium]|nr:minE [Hyphomicrobiales bacterium]